MLDARLVGGQVVELVEPVDYLGQVAPLARSSVADLALHTICICGIDLDPLLI